MKNSEQPAFPHIITELDEIDGTTVNNTEYSGLTKREYFAGLAMQGLLSNLRIVRPSDKDEKENVAFAKGCVQYADELLKQLKEQ